MLRRTYGESVRTMVSLITSGNIKQFSLPENVTTTASDAAVLFLPEDYRGAQSEFDVVEP